MSTCKKTQQKLCSKDDYDICYERSFLSYKGLTKNHILCILYRIATDL